jgi:hypothetical protein
MVEVVWLKPQEAPPKEGDWALVAEGRDGWPAGAVTAHPRGMTFHIPQAPSEVDRSEAIARACAWAERNEIDTVYIAHVDGRTTALESRSWVTGARDDARGVSGSF